LTGAFGKPERKIEGTGKTHGEGTTEAWEGEVGDTEKNGKTINKGLEREKKQGKNKENTQGKTARWKRKLGPAGKGGEKEKGPRKRAQGGSG